MQDDKQLFQIIGQIHGAIYAIEYSLFTLSCCQQTLADFSRF